MNDPGVPKPIHSAIAQHPLQGALRYREKTPGRCCDERFLIGRRWRPPLHPHHLGKKCPTGKWGEKKYYIISSLIICMGHTHITSNGKHGGLLIERWDMPLGFMIFSRIVLVPLLG
ncbi:hypothetical protein CDAR_378751 [Caerostris darwini]|uniref:Uncharacterized protein n=1 Tax=Caerostris darwini TaxID=1538125 RepID=A0AAV4MWI3_9ARAC|nr:hypothetical protein CDAR_378751 [Caerostris darwini]